DSDDPPTQRGSAARMLAIFPTFGGRLVEAVGLVALVVWLVGPLVWIALLSVQSDGQMSLDPPRLSLPLLLDGYRVLIADPAWQAAALVSITVTASATAIAVAIAALTAYPLARYRLRGGRPLLMALLGSQLIPPIALALPVLYIFIR